MRIFVGMLLACCTYMMSAAGVAAQSGNLSVLNKRIPYAAHADHLRAVHFHELSYNLDDEWVQLHGGKYEKQYEGFGGESAQLKKLWFFDVHDGEPQHALVWIESTQCGASCGVGGYATVFELRDGVLQQIQQFSFNGKTFRAGVEFDPVRMLMTITGRSEKDRSSECCASLLDVNTLAWKDGAFLETAYKLVPVKN